MGRYELRKKSGNAKKCLLELNRCLYNKIGYNKRSNKIGERKKQMKNTKEKMYKIQMLKDGEILKYEFNEEDTRFIIEQLFDWELIQERIDYTSGGKYYSLEQILNRFIGELFIMKDWDGKYLEEKVFQDQRTNEVLKVLDFMKSKREIFN